MYGFFKHPDSPDFNITLNGDEIGTVSDQDSAYTLIGYLNAGQGGFTVAPHTDDEKREYAFVSNEDIWVAYTNSEASAEAILGHLNRND